MRHRLLPEPASVVLFRVSGLHPGIPRQPRNQLEFLFIGTDSAYEPICDPTVAVGGFILHGARGC